MTMRRWCGSGRSTWLNTYVAVRTNVDDAMLHPVSWADRGLVGRALVTRSFPGCYPPDTSAYFVSRRYPRYIAYYLLACFPNETRNWTGRRIITRYGL